VSNEGFAECLDIFVQFFIDPLLKEDMVTAELSAVDSEYRKDLSIKEWKDYFIQKATMD
jgi:secreted Zn-dependent insulinase-like peptidase